VGANLIYFLVPFARAPRLYIANDVLLLKNDFILQENEFYFAISLGSSIEEYQEAKFAFKPRTTPNHTLNLK